MHVFFDKVRIGVATTNGYIAIAEVVDIGQTGIVMNGDPNMRMVLRIAGHGRSRKVAIRQYINIDNIPRVGDLVLIQVGGGAGRIKYLKISPYGN
ncbi:hypothetical protein DF022_37490 [Burkholderia cepacia]|nr:hypothetical protein DF023_37435 [Burkholderia cepacia]RQT92297.1 hypothetical protein DF022_37490 [Burkholderia cepacia]RQZ68913.1 hypothetical protein DF056_37825 [Burkholderia cepacia]RQZ91539.1 hypothetical protein DF055_37685 [Burkholderia cepacia]RQZ96110.1 hypothetical protein DF054_37705 [Burkholderia cepacia]